MADRLFWDCGGQFDLADITGSLYVPGTAGIRPRWARLSAAARAKGIPRILTRITRPADDAAFTTEKPDFKATFPAHCVAGTPGHRLIPEAAADGAAELPAGAPDSEAARRALVGGGHAVVDVAGFDAWAHPALPALIESLAPRQVFVYGVPGEHLVAAAVNGLLERGVAVTVIEDAMRPFSAAAWDQLRTGWAEGVTFASHRTVV